jgi:hypothetical protein
MRDYQRFPNDSFIAFKVPTPLKSILLQMADREGASLSQFLRRHCIDVARATPTAPNGNPTASPQPPPGNSYGR